MVHWHRLDPPELDKACDDAGALVAQRILEWQDIVTSLHDAAVRGGYQGDPKGLHNRIAWAVQESADAWGIRRDKAEWAIRRGIQPMLEAWEDWRVILANAEDINREAGSPLLRPEVIETVKDAMRAHIRRVEAEKRRPRHAR